MASFEENFYGFLTGIAGLSSLAIGTSPETYRIYPVFAPESKAVPLIIYRVISQLRDHTFDGPRSVVRTRVQIDIFSGSYTQSVTLSEAIRLSLNGYSDVMGDMDVHYATFENRQDFFDQDADINRISDDYIITHVEGV